MGVLLEHYLGQSTMSSYERGLIYLPSSGTALKAPIPLLSTMALAADNTDLVETN